VLLEKWNVYFKQSIFHLPVARRETDTHQGAGAIRVV
jgi:hypothetical protein